jgi:predicted CXXCH cytochrome family protein
MEWSLFLLFLGVALALLTLARRRFPRYAKAGLALALLGAVVAAWALHTTTERRLRNRAEFAKHVPREGRPGGYVSSDKCQSCHPGEYASWHRSFHRTMTQYASPDSIKANFDDVDLELQGETYRLERRGDEFWAELPDPDWGHVAERGATSAASTTPARVWKRIGLLTGSHHMQVFWVPSRYGNTQYVFPFVWLLADRRWAPLHDTFLRDPKIAPTKHIWNVNCIKCHTTGPQPRPGSGGVLDTRAGEIGIACEACHGPAEEHVRLHQNPLRRATLHLRGETLTDIVNPRKLPAARSSQICGQCHGIKWITDPQGFLRDGFSYRPGMDLEESTPIVRPLRLDQQPWLREPLRRSPNFLPEHYWSDGEVRVSGREFSGLIDSACHEKGGLSCVSCHSLHSSDPNDQLARDMESNRACLRCHTDYESKLTAHTHHGASSSGSLCYNCHMPHTVYGLMKAIRTHKIDNPTVESSLTTGRPNACNLCHLDQTLAWSAKYLHDWYRQPLPRLGEDEQAIAASVLWALQGDAGQRALLAWHMGWDSATQASGQSWIVPYLAQLLVDPYSTVRYIAHRSLKRAPGFESFGFDFVGPSPARETARQRAFTLWQTSFKSDRTTEPTLIAPDGTLKRAVLDRLLARRDDRSMDLQE